MKFRAYILFAAIYSALASLPLRVRFGAAALLGAWLAVDLSLEVLRQRRARNRAPVAPDPDPWVECNADYYAPFGADQARGGLRGQCLQRRGHDGPHSASVDVEWP